MDNGSWDANDGPIHKILITSLIADLFATNVNIKFYIITISKFGFIRKFDYYYIYDKGAPDNLVNYDPYGMGVA